MKRNLYTWQQHLIELSMLKKLHQCLLRAAALHCRQIHVPDYLCAGNSESLWRESSQSCMIYNIQLNHWLKHNGNEAQSLYMAAASH
jgi:hypothetical protein